MPSSHLGLVLGRRWYYRLLLLVVALVATTITTAAHACTCWTPPLQERFESHDGVFTAQARVLDQGPGWQLVRLDTSEWFRGQPQEHVNLHQTGLGGSCDQSFVDLERYLVYARTGKAGWSVSFCGGTRQLSDLDQGELAEVRRLGRELAAEQARWSTIRGRLWRVVDAERLLVADALVALETPSLRILRRTDATGGFVFPYLRAGTYTLSLVEPVALELTHAPEPIEIARPGVTVELDLDVAFAKSIPSPAAP